MDAILAAAGDARAGVQEKSVSVCTTECSVQCEHSQRHAVDNKGLAAVAIACAILHFVAVSLLSCGRSAVGIWIRASGVWEILTITTRN